MTGDDAGTESNSHPGRDRRPRWSLPASAVPFVLAIVLSACGSSPSGVASIGSSTTSSTVPAGNSGGPASPTQTKELLAFSRCIRAHGVPGFPDPTASSGFPNSARNYTNTPQFTAAETACKSLALAAGVIKSPAAQAQHLKQLSAEDACIRKHGVPNMPGPDTQGQQTFPPGISPETPTFHTAELACNYLNP